MGEMKQRDATRGLVGSCQILLIPSTRTSLECSDAANATSAAELWGYRTASPNCTRNVSEQMWWRDVASGRGDFRSCQMGPIEQDLVNESLPIRPYGGTMVEDGEQSSWQSPKNGINDEAKKGRVARRDARMLSECLTGRTDGCSTAFLAKTVSTLAAPARRIFPSGPQLGDFFLVSAN